MRLCLFTILLSISLMACEPEPTPFPVDVPVTPTPTLSPTELPPLYYALAQNTTGYVVDMEQIRAAAQVEQLNDPVNEVELGTRYDIVVSFGEFAGWTRTAITPQVILVINPDAESLTPEIMSVIRESVNAESIVNGLGIPGLTILQTVAVVNPSSLRERLANLGHPDGLHLAFGYTPVPGVNSLVAQFDQVNLTVRLIALEKDTLVSEFEAGRLHLALLSAVSADERQGWIDRAGAENVIDLYSLPISYLAVDGLSISLTPAGWPIVRRAS